MHVKNIINVTFIYLQNKEEPSFCLFPFSVNWNDTGPVNIIFFFENCLMCTIANHITRRFPFNLAEPIIELHFLGCLCSFSRMFVKVTLELLSTRQDAIKHCGLRRTTETLESCQKLFIKRRDNVWQCEYLCYFKGHTLGLQNLDEGVYA